MIYSNVQYISSANDSSSRGILGTNISKNINFLKSDATD